MVAAGDIIIRETKQNPGVRFKLNGHLSFEGRSFSEDPYRFYLPLLKWCVKLNSKEVRLDFKVDFMNAVSVRYLYNIIKNLENNKSINSIYINWFYDINDINLLELGQLIGETCKKAIFNFKVKPELSN